MRPLAQFGRRPLPAALALWSVLLATGVVAGSSGPGGVRAGSALWDDGGLQGGSGPVLAGEPLTFGLIHTENRSSQPVELVSARPLRLDPDLELLGFTARPVQGAPATAREHPVDHAVPLDEFPVLEPGRQEEVAILFALRVRPGAIGGSAVGTEVTYREGGKLRRQVFKTEAHLCEAATLQSDCADKLHENFGDYDEEVRKRLEAALPGPSVACCS